MRRAGPGGAGRGGQRQRSRAGLWRAFGNAGVAEGPPPPADQPTPAVDAALGHVAKTPSPLMLAPLEDIMGVAEQPNLPGTIDEHPNWRRRLSVNARDLFAAPDVRARVAIINERRK